MPRTPIVPKLAGVTASRPGHPRSTTPTTTTPRPPRPAQPRAAPLRSAFAMPKIGEDIRLLPGMLLHVKKLWIPFALLFASFFLALSWIGGCLPAGADQIVGTFVALTLPPTALFVFFIGGFLAPRASYLVGAVLGLVDGILYTIVLLLAPRRRRSRTGRLLKRRPGSSTCCWSSSSRSCSGRSLPGSRRGTATSCASRRSAHARTAWLESSRPRRRPRKTPARSARRSARRPRRHVRQPARRQPRRPSRPGGRPAADRSPAAPCRDAQAGRAAGAAADRSLAARAGTPKRRPAGRRGGRPIPGGACRRGPCAARRPAAPDRRRDGTPRRAAGSAAPPG